MKAVRLFTTALCSFGLLWTAIILGLPALLYALLFCALGVLILYILAAGEPARHCTACNQVFPESLITRIPDTAYSKDRALCYRCAPNPQPDNLKT